MAEYEWKERNRHQVAISGQVTDAQEERPLQGILVKITNGPSEFMQRLQFLQNLKGLELWETMKERLDQTITSPSGHYHFIDLPLGQYTLEAKHPSARNRRFGKDTGTATVASANSTADEEKIVAAELYFNLPVTTLEGYITKAHGGGDDEGNAIYMAEIRVLGSGERAFSDEEGFYSLVGIEYGDRSVVVNATGYNQMEANVNVEGIGSVVTQDFSLTKKTVVKKKASRRSRN